MIIPREVRTERLYLRAWRASDAAALLPVLQANATHLRWIPPSVASAVPLPELEERLDRFAAEFDADQSWRFGIFPPDASDVWGEISLFPRNATERVALPLADRLEIGYWLRQDLNGRGYVTEACRALIALAMCLPRMRHVEIRCDPLNERSAAVPKRLGFSTSHVTGEAGNMVWVSALQDARVSGGDDDAR